MTKRTIKTTTTTSVTNSNHTTTTRRTRYTQLHTAGPMVAIDYVLLQEALRYLEKLGNALDHKGMRYLVETIDRRLERVLA